MPRWTAEHSQSKVCNQSVLAIHIDSGPCRAVGRASGALRTQTSAVFGLETALMRELMPWASR